VAAEAPVSWTCFAWAQLPAPMFGPSSGGPPVLVRTLALVLGQVLQVTPSASAALRQPLRVRRRKTR